MKLLVFGRNGQLGRALAALPGHEVTALGREEGDLADPAACAAAITACGAEAVINAAAWTDVDGAEAQEEAARVVNALAPGAMARACAARGLPFVHVSSDYVFDGGGTAPHAPGDAVAPLNAYGRTKVEGEGLVAAAGGGWAVLRTSWVFDREGKNFLTTMLRLSESRDHLRVVADQVGGPTPAPALARALVRVAEGLGQGARPGLYHYAGAPEVSWAEFARAIFAAWGRKVTVEDIPTSAWPTPAARPLNSRLDCTATEAEFGLARPDWRGALGGMVGVRGA